MQTLVIGKSSVSVKLEADHLIIHDHAVKDMVPVKVPLVDIERLVVSGQPSISFPVLAKMMDRQIPCSFMTAGGRWRGTMDGDRGFHAGRRMRQYESLADDAFRLHFTKRVIAAKIANSRRTLQRLAANRKLALEGNSEWIGISNCIGAVPLMETADAVRGIEGVAAARYFRLLSRFFPKEAPFTVRTRRPPRDAANSLLSFCYTLLENEVVAAVRRHGLDVAAGYFHRDHDHSPSLALDLMEPFRPMADRLVLDLLNHRRVRADEHFEPGENGGIYLADTGRPIVFRAFDEMMRRKLDAENGHLDLRQLIDRDVCRFLGMLEAGESPNFFHAA